MTRLYSTNINVLTELTILLKPCFSVGMYNVTPAQSSALIQTGVQGAEILETL